VGVSPGGCLLADGPGGWKHGSPRGRWAPHSHSPSARTSSAWLPQRCSAPPLLGPSSLRDTSERRLRTSSPRVFLETLLCGRTEKKQPGQGCPPLTPCRQHPACSGKARHADHCQHPNTAARRGDGDPPARAELFAVSPEPFPQLKSEVRRVNSPFAWVKESSSYRNTALSRAFRVGRLFCPEQIFNLCRQLKKSPESQQEFTSPSPPSEQPDNLVRERRQERT